MENNQNKNNIWHVVYTRSRSEKKVRDELTLKKIECFLPIQKKLRQWKDRKKWVEMPLISGYCFVNITRKEYDEVLRTDNVINYVTFEGKAAVIPEQQIFALKQLLKQNDFEVEVTHENFEPGKKVEIIEGPLVGLKGELVSHHGKNKFILKIEQINSAFTIEVKATKLTFISSD
jgi:transcription antitermination factor NusG